MTLSAKIGIALFIGLLSNEIGVLIEYLVPNADNIYADHAFIDRSYHVPFDPTKQKGGLTLPYYFYEQSLYWYHIIIFGSWYFSIRQVNKKLSYIILTFLSFHLVQEYFYLYDRNTSFLCNWICYTIMIFVVLEWFIPEKRLGKIVNME